MRILTKVLIFFGALQLIWSFHAHAVTRYVSISGVDSSNDCQNALSPCGTVQHAIAISGNSDVTKIAQGQYNENISMDAGVTVNVLEIQGGWNWDFSKRDDRPTLTVIDGGGTGTTFRIEAFSRDRDVVISGLTLRNGMASAGGGVYMESSNATGRLTMKKNIIRGNEAGSKGGGVYVRTPSGSTSLDMTNNIITGNTSGMAGGGLYIESQQPYKTVVTLINNTISGNTSIGGGGIYAFAHLGGITDLRIVNTIVWGNTASSNGDDIEYYEDDLSGDSDVTVGVWYSDIGDVYRTTTEGTYNDNGGNISENPLFSSPAANNFHLRYGSGAIDTAWCGTLNPDYTYTRVAPYNDFEGDARPGDPAYLGCDMGADEYVPTDAMPWILLLLQGP